MVAQHSNILKQAWGGPCKPTNHWFPLNFTFSDKFKAHCEVLGDTYKNTKLSAAIYILQQVTKEQKSTEHKIAHSNWVQCDAITLIINLLLSL